MGRKRFGKNLAISGRSGRKCGGGLEQEMQIKFFRRKESGGEKRERKETNGKEA